MSDAHDHDTGAAFQQRQLTPAQNRGCEILIKAIEALLTETTLISTALLNTVPESYENDSGPLRWLPDGCSDLDGSRL